MHKALKMYKEMLMIFFFQQVFQRYAQDWVSITNSLSVLIIQTSEKCAFGEEILYTVDFKSTYHRF